MKRQIQGGQILDTSAVNWLYRDPRRDELIARLSGAVVLPTTVSITELAATPDEPTRFALIRLLKTICGNHVPLVAPNELIVRACKAFGNNADIGLDVQDGVQEIWDELDDPASVNSELQELARVYNNKMEGEFKIMYRAMRGDIEAANLPRPTSPLTFRNLIRFFLGREALVYKFVNDIYEGSVGMTLPPQKLSLLLNSNPIWEPFLLGYAFAFHQRVIKQSRYGAKKNPGQMDLWSAGYLLSCDYFVTGRTSSRSTCPVSQSLAVERCIGLSH